MVKNKRILSPREQTHLARFSIPQVKWDQIGEQPVEYVTGKAEFYGQVFSVNENVLIPRVETEELVDLVLSTIRDEYPAHEKLIIADVGCGSGAIGLSLAKVLGKLRPGTQLYLSDYSAQAVEVAKKNSQLLLSSEENQKIEFLTSDLLINYPPVIFDVVVANLPYIPSERVSYLDESVKDFEPHLALKGGPEGLTLIYRLLDQIDRFLSPTGWLFLEIDHTHSLDDFRQYKKDWKIELFKDEFGQNRFLRLKKIDSITEF